MKLRISASSAVVRHYLEADEIGVVYCESAAFAQLRRFSYDQIDAIMRDHAYLSIQVGRDVYKIPYSAAKTEHMLLTAMLVDGCRKTCSR